MEAIYRDAGGWRTMSSRGDAPLLPSDPFAGKAGPLWTYEVAAPAPQRNIISRLVHESAAGDSQDWPISISRSQCVWANSFPFSGSSRSSRSKNRGVGQSTLMQCSSPDRRGEGRGASYLPLKHRIIARGGRVWPRSSTGGTHGGGDGAMQREGRVRARECVRRAVFFVSSGSSSSSSSNNLS